MDKNYLIKKLKEFLIMQIQPNFKKGGYSSNTALEYVDPKKAIYSLSTELFPQQRFENNQPTGEIIAYKAWFVQEGLPPFTVKFEDKIDLPQYLSIIQFEDLQACEVRYNVYFKAVGIKEVK